MTFVVSLPERGMFDAWRKAARLAISHRITPEQIEWNGVEGLFAAQALPTNPGPHQTNVPAAFIKLAGTVIWHGAPERFSLLYQALCRIDGGDLLPLSQADPLGRRLHLMAKSVRRDIHKMHAFVRFRECPSDGHRRSFAAWFEPEHNTLEPGSAFFVKRFSDMDWMIATPALTAHFRNGALSFGPAGARPDMPDDASEALWATYFANIFNPARIKLDAMRSEMPKKYWKNLPETRLIPEMLQDAEARVQRMRAAGGTEARPGSAAVSTRYRAGMAHAPDMPETLDEARVAARQCRKCGLCEAATQTVWGDGADEAALMIVGEQPGDQEDLSGRPFVGPAGQILRQALAEVDIDPADVWLTNAVKHFKFVPRGKRRIHQAPNRQEIQHCRWWLGLEIGFVQPKLTVALGASAAFALTGDDSPLSARRGQVQTGLHEGPVLVSWHPSHILRVTDADQQRRAREQLVEDLAEARRLIENTEI